MKYLVIAAFAGIIGSLGAALVFMMRGGSAQPQDPQEGGDSNAPPGPNRRMARALAWRVGLSVLLFVIVLASYFLGWIQPTGLPVAH